MVRPPPAPMLSATPALARGRYDHRDRDGIGAGEIIAGAVVLGGLAAILSTITIVTIAMTGTIVDIATRTMIRDTAMVMIMAAMATVAQRSANASVPSSWHQPLWPHRRDAGHEHRSQARRLSRQGSRRRQRRLARTLGSRRFSIAASSAATCGMAASSTSIIRVCGNAEPLLPARPRFGVRRAALHKSVAGRG